MPPQAELKKLADSLKAKEFPHKIVNVAIVDNSSSPKALFKKTKGKDEVETYFASSEGGVNELLYQVSYETNPLKMFDEFHANAIAAGEKYKKLMVKFIGVVERITARANGKEGCVIFKSEREFEFGSLKCCTAMDMPQALALKDMKPGDKVSAIGGFSHYDGDLNISMCLFSKGE